MISSDDLQWGRVVIVMCVCVICSLSLAWNYSFEYPDLISLVPIVPVLKSILRVALKLYWLNLNLKVITKASESPQGFRTARVKNAIKDGGRQNLCIQLSVIYSIRRKEKKLSTFPPFIILLEHFFTARKKNAPIAEVNDTEQMGIFSTYALLDFKLL